MSLTIKVTRPNLRGIDFAPTRLMRTIGQGLVGRIRSRTQAGKDVDGRPFRALSPGYAAQKRQALGHSRADLTVSGRMLNDMVAKPRPNGLRIQFVSGGSGRGSGSFIQRSRAVGANDKAFFHNETGAGRRGAIREFFALSDDDETFILDKISAHLDRVL